MKERPILFSAPMVRAILAGTKTQTRRVVKPGSGPHTTEQVISTPDSLAAFIRHRCPYGQPGDRLWVRETWAAVHFSVDPETGYCDDWHGSHDIPPGDGGGYWSKLYAADNHPTDKEDRGFAWRPSIHMPRWASRITLEVTGVRVERLNEISEDDAAAEGVDFGNITDPLTGEIDRDACEAFMWLWESISGPRSWDANPWVWVVEFRRL